MGRCQLMILLLTLCLINFNSRAKPPDIVWRVDTRDYKEIFNDGFYSSGTNDDIVEHLSGRSCRSAESDYGDSAFISTTADRSFAYDYLERVLKNIKTTMTSSAKAYIYQIRADTNMYSADHTLDFLLRLGASEIQQEIHRIFRYAPYLSEWMAHRRVLAEQVMSATSYLLHQGNVMFNGYIPNPFYQQTRSSASMNPYHSAFIVPSALNMMRTWMLRMGIRPMIRACFGSMDSISFKRSLDSIYSGHGKMFKLVAIL
ncbi:putative AB5 enterotoxin ADP-ribosylating subunit YtxA [Yersinia enterocolitica]|uniref:putative AB5 enterotoxin ADP-ribosylating subunit YtxA n=1 Tax=Yersinia enterocolitica TaxID=630 RepID=UPI0029BB3C1F|nr:putative AB5 enterotoxin ADP-ribosylating subunit YtxA [Yersinia enterocolitica]